MAISQPNCNCQKAPKGLGSDLVYLGILYYHLACVPQVEFDLQVGLGKFPKHKRKALQCPKAFSSGFEPGLGSPASAGFEPRLGSEALGFRVYIIYYKALSALCTLNEVLECVTEHKANSLCSPAWILAPHTFGAWC